MGYFPTQTVGYVGADMRTPCQKVGFSDPVPRKADPVTRKTDPVFEGETKRGKCDKGVCTVITVITKDKNVEKKLNALRELRCYDHLQSILGLDLISF